MDHPILWAFGLTLMAGLSTGIGSAIALFARRTNKTFLSGALGLSAGVMLYLSFAEILPSSRETLSKSFGPTSGSWLAVAGFFAGIVLILIIDRFVPSSHNPHEAKLVEDMTPEQRAEQQSTRSDSKLLRMGLFTALAIAIHNFPEGLATFTATLTQPKLGLGIAIAIAIHNIPEGIAVSVPVYYATGNRSKAFWYSFLSGMSEPVGAVIGYFLLRLFLSDSVFGMVFAAVGGIMVFISLDELIPTAREYGAGHTAIYGVVGGMALMAVSLMLLA